MHALRIAIAIVWAVFWTGWLIAALASKRGTIRARSMGSRVLVLAAIIITRFAVGRGHGLTAKIHSWPPMIIGTAVLLLGLALAIWARVTTGRNWGLPMTLKNEPELVTSGPFRFIRHPIYSGVILALLGTAAAIGLSVLILAAVLAAYFVWSARSEEKLLSSAMPDSYPAYMRRTKMLIPFIF